MADDASAGDRGVFRFEHLALNLANREAFERWYVENLELVVARSVPSEKSFLADRNGTVIFELYDNKSAPYTELRDTEPLTFHVAFAVDDVEAAAARLVAAGARVVEPVKVVDGDRLAMMEDPFGLSLQLVCRKSSMFV